MDAHPDHRSWARLEALARADKWYLSAGEGLLWAPSFPRWLHRPGFWDEARVYHFALEPCFTVALVGDDGSEDPLTREGIQWRPDRLKVHWRSGSNLSFTETRYLLPGGRICSAWRTDEDLGWPNPVFRDRFLAVHTAAPAGCVAGMRRRHAGLAWRRLLRSDDGADTLTVEQALEVHLFPPRGHHPVDPEARSALRLAAGEAWVAAARSEGPAGPEWDLSPFAEGFARRLEGDRAWPAEGDGGDDDCVHLAAVLPLHHLPARHAVGLVLRVIPRIRPHQGDADPGTAGRTGSDPRGADGPERDVPGTESAEGGGEERDGGPDPLGELETPAPVPRPGLARERWCRAFGRFPRFRCSDPFLSGYFDYRIYGLHLNRLAGGRPHLPFPAVAEGPGPLHHPTAGSAPCHMLETRWSQDPSLARGTLLNFIAHQRDDGSFPTRLYVHRPPDDDICHMNWGDAVRAVDRLHPQRAFLERAYGALARYGAWVARTRDPEDSGLITLARPQEASQDHTPRWEAASGSDLKAVDASVCACQLWQALAEMAAALGHDDEVERWRARRLRSAQALDTLWDEEAGIYRDLDPATGRLTDVKASAGLRPLLTTVPDEDRVRRLLTHLEPGGAFATPFPVPTLATDDPRFDAEGVWKGRRRKRPFNGRVWPTVTCHVVDGLLRQWHRGVSAAGPVAARVLRDFVRMLHAGDAPPRPNSFEHYNPLTGRPSLFRGLDDHQRSWVLDLILRGVAGVEPLPSGLRIHPLPMGLESVELDATLRGRRIRVAIRGEAVSVAMDGGAHETTVGSPLEISW